MRDCFLIQEEPGRFCLPGGKGCFDCVGGDRGGVFFWVGLLVGAEGLNQPWRDGFSGEFLREPLHPRQRYRSVVDDICKPLVGPLGGPFVVGFDCPDRVGRDGAGGGHLAAHD